MELHMSLQKNRRAVIRYAKAMRFSSWLQGLIQKMTPAPYRLIQIWDVSGYFTV